MDDLVVIVNSKTPCAPLLMFLMSDGISSVLRMIIACCDDYPMREFLHVSPVRESLLK